MSELCAITLLGGRDLSRELSQDSPIIQHMQQLRIIQTYFPQYFGIMITYAISIYSQIILQQMKTLQELVLQENVFISRKDKEEMS